jgi:outer membrane protein
MKPFSVVLAALALGISQTVPASDLEDIRNAAWQADSEWAVARRTWEAEQENVTQGRAALLPSVDASYSDIETERELEGEPTEQEFDTKILSVQAVQPLFRPGAWYRYKQSKAATSQAEAEFKRARQDFLLRVSEQYLGVLRTWDNLVAARAEEKAIGRQLEQTRERFDVGLVPVTDVEEAQAAYDLSQANLIVAESNFFVARDRIEALTNQRWDELATLREDLPLAGPEPADPEQWVELARGSNPDVTASRHAATASRYQARQQLSQQLPSVDLVGSWSESEQPFSLGEQLSSEFETTETRVGIEVSMPLFRGGALNSQRKQAALRHEAAEEQYQRVYRDAGQQARSLFRTVSADALRVKARKQAIRSARSALEATRSGYEVGTRNVVDVLSAQRNLFNAQRDYANARYDYILNGLRLKATAGVLQEEDLAQVNAWLSEDNQVSLYDQSSALTDDSTR